MDEEEDEVFPLPPAPSDFRKASKGVFEFPPGVNLQPILVHNPCRLLAMVKSQVLCGALTLEFPQCLYSLQHLYPRTSTIVNTKKKDATTLQQPTLSSSSALHCQQAVHVK
ncbi:hypothetical protein EB796_008850 [Bugula neritina]|uniref:Uncharacterized protein n=1 Tax=Bugula neritina TaxID=10212 RepID=A0A7J7K3P1_BUGNE|nr:hypothetical protein EB796_008850 [Bugula neritina]